MCGRLQGQANQKLDCGWSLKYQSLPAMHIKGLNLTLNECIRICQTEDATRRQVQPLDSDCTDSTPIHHMTEFPQAHPRTNLRGRGGYRGPFRGGRPATGWMGGACPQRDYRLVLRLHVATAAHGPTKQRERQGCGPRVPSLWQTWTFFKSMQTKVRLSK